jgi:glycerophosphoryl diester phosphodiesterase
MRFSRRILPVELHVLSGVLTAVLAFIAAMILSAEPRILVHGHRGARAMRPENTLPAFEYAIAQGVDVLELDMAVTRDGIVVISHDPRLSRTVCQGPEGGETAIHKLTFAQVRQWDCGALQNPSFPKQKPMPGTKMPTLEEVFDLAAASGVQFNIETKIDPKKPDLAPDPATFARLVVDLVRKHGMEKRVMMQSFDFRTLKEVRTLAPELHLSALYSGAPKSFIEIAREAAGAEIVSPHFRLVTREEVQAAHDAGIQVIPWTANIPDVWRQLVDARVDAIISDDPAELIAWLQSAGLR